MTANNNPKPCALTRAEFKSFRPVTTRWMDNDCYGHVNNVVYYSWFDTAVNTYLIEQGVLRITEPEVIGLVVNSSCHYFAPLAYPEVVDAGIVVSKMGRSSVEYKIGIFAQSSEHSAAWGTFIHVYVDPVSRKPVKQLPPALTTVLEKIYG